MSFIEQDVKTISLIKQVVIDEGQDVKTELGSLIPNKVVPNGKQVVLNLQIHGQIQDKP